MHEYADRDSQSRQRLRIVFRKGPAIKFISHLDLMRAWERSLRRSGLPVAYSHGFNPRPKLSFASALPVGFVGRAEVVDVLLERPVELHEFATRLRPELPRGLDLCSVTDVPLALPALSSQVVAADYEVTIQNGAGSSDLQSRLHLLLAEDSLMRCRQRPDGVRVYDLRPLIQRLDLLHQGVHSMVVGMQLSAGPRGTGRPDEVMTALGLADQVRAIERVQLHFSRVRQGDLPAI